MRRAVLAMVLCAAPLLTAPAAASPNLLDREALRAAERLQAGSAHAGAVRPLPLAADSRTHARSVRSARGELARIASSSAPRRVLVGVLAHRDLPGVARALERLGARPERFGSIGVLAARVPDGAELVRTLRADPRVGYIERDRKLRAAADPLDTVDPATGVKFTWYYDDVHAGEALAATGGGSSRRVAVLDSGLDLTHPEFAGRVAGTFDTFTRTTIVPDTYGHGTFVTGLINAIDGNGIGAKGVAGNTKVLVVRASLDGGFTERDLLRGIEFAVRHGADVLNLSLAGAVTRSIVRALTGAFYNDVLPVAASGNTGDKNNAIQFPAAVLGGRNGRRGIGLSVGATRPGGTVADFSTHNAFVSLAAPGAGPFGCEFGVVSALPATTHTEWDRPTSCSPLLSDASGARFAYGEGTSFSAPIVSGIAALTWQVEPRLASEQVADVLTRSARQTQGTGWNEFTGAGVVDGKAATDLARVYDVLAPRAKARARRHGDRVAVRVAGTTDRTEPGRELAGRVSYGLLVSRDGGRNFAAVTHRHRRPFRTSVRLRGTRANVLVATACDANGNCGVKRLGRFRR